MIGAVKGTFLAVPHLHVRLCFFFFFPSRYYFAFAARIRYHLSPILALKGFLCYHLSRFSPAFFANCSPPFSCTPAGVSFLDFPHPPACLLLGRLCGEIVPFLHETDGDDNAAAAAGD